MLGKCLSQQSEQKVAYYGPPSVKADDVKFYHAPPPARLAATPPVKSAHPIFPAVFPAVNFAEVIELLIELHTVDAKCESIQ